MPEHQTDHQSTHKVRIHIDRQPCESPTPTTGEALYALAKVPPGHWLYREVRGEHEDAPIANDKKELHLKEDEHFYTAKIEIKIFVNTRPTIVSEDTVTFQQVTELAYPGPHDPKTFFKVAYRKAPDDKHGTLTLGQSVTVKEGTIFDVTKIDKS